MLLETPPLLADATVWPCSGANGAALGLLCAWLVDDRLAARRGDDRENDLLGVYVIAAVLVLLSLTTQEANIGAAVGGALAGSADRAAAAAARPLVSALMFSDEQVDAAVRALSDPERFAGAERLMPGRRRSFSASWRRRSRRAAGSAPRTSRRCAPPSPSPTRPRALPVSRPCSPRRPGWACWSAWPWAGSSPRELGNPTEPEGD